MQALALLNFHVPRLVLLSTLHAATHLLTHTHTHTKQPLNVSHWSLPRHVICSVCVVCLELCGQGGDWKTWKLIQKTWKLAWIPSVTSAVWAAQDEILHVQQAEEKKDECFDYRPISNLPLMAEPNEGCLP